jgi:nitrate reductase beta subunit
MATNGKENGQRQLAWVFDLNKCVGCQTCSVSCKVLWTEEEEGGTEQMWWMTVNTKPGRGTPRDWETMGGGYQDGKLQTGKLPTRDEFGGGWTYNYDEVLRGGKGRDVHLERKGEGARVTDAARWGPNWDEDEGGGEEPVVRRGVS